MCRNLRILCIFVTCLFFSGCWRKNSSYTGYIQPQYHYASSPSGGILSEIFVSDGQIVLNGDSLFALDSVFFSLNVDQARAELEKNTEILNYAQKEYERSCDLWEKSVLSDEIWEKSKRDYFVAKKNTELSEIALLHSLQKFKESQPRSPVQGIVQKHYYTPGDYVPPGAPVLSVHIPEQTKIVFYVPVEQMPQFSIGQEVGFRYAKKTEIFKAKISFLSAAPEYTPPVIYSQSFEHSLSYLVEAILDSHQSHAVLGMPVEVFLYDKS